MKIKENFFELKVFLVLWSTQAISSLGTAMTSYALIVWVYGQRETASSITLLTLCSFVPTILLRFIAGTLADRWDKRKVMLVCDAAAACGTLIIGVLHSLAALRIWHLYVINALLSCMNAFQIPASRVATSLLVPKKHFARAGGMQAFSGSVTSLLAPALGSAIFAWGGLRAVLTADLCTFAVAFLSLWLFIRLPEQAASSSKKNSSFWQECRIGIHFLKESKPLLQLILFVSAINFLAKIGGDGMQAAFVLARTNGDQQTLGMVQTAVSLGIMTGSLLMTWLKPAKNRHAAIFLSCALTFFIGNVGQSLTVSVPLWCTAVFLSYLMAAVMNVHLTVVMREEVPVELQGRVFSAKDTLQNISVPMGLLAGGFLADHVLEPFMQGMSPGQQLLSAVFGSGHGTGIALLFCLAGIAGTGLSLAGLWFSCRRKST